MKNSFRWRSKSFNVAAQRENEKSDADQCRETYDMSDIATAPKDKVIKGQWSFGEPPSHVMDFETSPISPLTRKALSSLADRNEKKKTPKNGNDESSLPKTPNHYVLITSKGPALQPPPTIKSTLQKKAFLALSQAKGCESRRIEKRRNMRSRSRSISKTSVAPAGDDSKVVPNETQSEMDKKKSLSDDEYTLNDINGRKSKARSELMERDKTGRARAKTKWRKRLYERKRNQYANESSTTNLDNSLDETDDPFDIFESKENEFQVFSDTEISINRKGFESFDEQPFQNRSTFLDANLSASFHYDERNSEAEDDGLLRKQVAEITLDEDQQTSPLLTKTENVVSPTSQQHQTTKSFTAISDLAKKSRKFFENEATNDNNDFDQLGFDNGTEMNQIGNRTKRISKHSSKTGTYYETKDMNDLLFDFKHVPYSPSPDEGGDRGKTLDTEKAPQQCLPSKIKDPSDDDINGYINGCEPFNADFVTESEISGNDSANNSLIAKNQSDSTAEANVNATGEVDAKQMQTDDLTEVTEACDETNEYHQLMIKAEKIPDTIQIDDKKNKGIMALDDPSPHMTENVNKISPIVERPNESRRTYTPRKSSDGEYVSLGSSTNTNSNASDLSKTSVKNLKNWLVHIESKNRNYQENIGNRSKAFISDSNATFKNELKSLHVNKQVSSSHEIHTSHSTKVPSPLLERKTNFDSQEAVPLRHVLSTGSISSFPNKIQTTKKNLASNSPPILVKKNNPKPLPIPKVLPSRDMQMQMQMQGSMRNKSMDVIELKSIHMTKLFQSSPSKSLEVKTNFDPHETVPLRHVQSTGSSSSSYSNKIEAVKRMFDTQSAVDVSRPYPFYPSTSSFGSGKYTGSLSSTPTSHSRNLGMTNAALERIKSNAVKSYVPPTKIKPKLDRSDVAATNDSRVPVSKISEWLSDDPFEMKKAKSIRRGQNIQMKSKAFEPDLPSPSKKKNVVHSVSGNVSDRKKWIESGFRSGDKEMWEEDGSDSNYNVADRAKWLQEKAFARTNANVRNAGFH